MGTDNLVYLIMKIRPKTSFGASFKDLNLIIKFEGHGWCMALVHDTNLLFRASGYAASRAEALGYFRDALEKKIL